MSTLPRNSNLALLTPLRSGFALCLLLVHCAALLPGGASAQENEPAASSETATIEEEEFESTLFDIYLADQYEGLILARFAPGWLEIDEPAAAVDQLPLVKDRVAVTALLAGRIEGSREVPGVGKVTVSLETFRIILQLDSEMLTTKPTDPLRLLGDPEPGWSLRQDLRTTYTGNYSSELANEFKGAFRHRTIAGHGKSWLNYDGTLVEDSDYELDAFNASSILGKTRLSGGYLRTAGQRFGGSVDFLGMSWQTAEEMLLDDEALRGSRLEVFIPSRSRVEFYRGGRLLDVQLLEFGLQNIDTSRFPQGSYDVEVVINESSGSVSREMRFFTKSGLLAVRDFPSFLFQAGYLRDIFRVDETPVYQLSTSWRALSFLQLEGSAYGTDEVTIGSLGLLGLFRQFFFSGGYSQSTEGYRGVYGDFSGDLFSLNFGGNYTGTLNGEVVEDRFIEDENSSPGFTNGFKATALSGQLSSEEQINNIARNRQTMGAYVFRRFGELEIRFDANRATDEERTTRYSVGPAFVWRILEDVSDSLRFEVSYLRTEQGETGSAVLGWQHRFSPWMVSSQLSARQRQGDNDDRLVTAVNYDVKNRAGQGTRARVTQETQYYNNEVGVVNSVEAQHVNHLVDASGFVRETRTTEDSLAFGIQTDTSLVVGREQTIRLSNPADHDAVIVARLDSRTATTPMQLVINGAEYGEITPGEGLVVGLQPYKRYQLSVRPSEKTELVDYEAEPINFSLFPGNVVIKNWTVERVFIALGKVVDETGAAIGREHLRNAKEYVVTEEDGSFQAEIAGTELLEISSARHHCRIALPEVANVEYYHDYGTVVCHPLPPGGPLTVSD